MKYSVLQVARHIIHRFEEQGQKVSNLKLQKLLYFSWIDFYIKNKKYLFEQSFEAWKFGPVNPDTYYNFCDFGGLPICLDLFGDKKITSEIKTSDAHILDSTINKYLKTSVFELVAKTHNKDGAWIATYSGDPKVKNIIPFELIIEKECTDKQ